MFYSIDYTQLFNVIHLCCYIVALILGVFVAMSIDYTKFIKAKSNMNYYITSFVVGAAITFVVGELLFNILTMFVK